MVAAKAPGEPLAVMTVAVSLWMTMICEPQVHELGLLLELVAVVLVQL
jgi:hypothetical protein